MFFPTILRSLLCLSVSLGAGFASEDFPVAAGPAWHDTNLDFPFRHVAGAHRATTGGDDPPLDARYDWQARQWMVAAIPNVSSITAVQAMGSNYVLIADNQRLMHSNWSAPAGAWSERYVLDEPSQKFLINTQAWQIVTDDSILLSSDGSLWQKHPAPAWRARAITSGFQSISPGVGHSLVVGDGGETFVSANGIEWSRIEIGTEEDLVAAAPLVQGRVVISATGRVFTTSTSMLHWTDHGVRLPPGVVSVSGDRPLFAITEDGRLFTSVNGSHWSERLLPDGKKAVSAGDQARHPPLIATQSGRLLQANHMIPYVGAYSGQDSVGELSLTVIYASNPFEWLHNEAPTAVSSARITATSSGEYSVLMNHSDGDILSDPIAVWIKETFEDWQRQQFDESELADPEVSGAAAAPGCDGVPNLLRFALAKSDAGVVMPEPVTLPSINESHAGEGRLALSFVRRKEAGRVEYLLETSPDLSAWNSTLGAGEILIEDLGEIERVTVPSPFSPAELEYLFLRLRVRLIE